MTHYHTSEDYALAIRTLGSNPAAPVVYDLNSLAIDIGSAEDNHIVLSGAGVEAYHLAVRQVGAKLCLLVDRSVAERWEDTFWLERRSGDSFFCPQHGQLHLPRKSGGCPLCQDPNGTLWLLRPLQAGDVFPIGQSFEASVLSQGMPNQAAENGDKTTLAPWPDTAWLENPPRRSAMLAGEQDLPTEERAYPFNDSNFWNWNPPQAPFPVFIHQRVNRHVSRHARDNPRHEVGGILLGQVYRAPQDSGIYPVITHAIAARFATQGRGHLTFTPDTWLDINQQREEHHPDKKIVGWYHTHPGLDVFLSEWDLFIHRNFFRQPWQVALVVDPSQDAGGIFVWAGGDILDPDHPHELFRVAEPDDGASGPRRARIRIKLGEPVP